jgi:membrane protein DedA with SNARE-associated domain
LAGFIEGAIRWAVAIVAAHQYVLLFAIISVEEAGVPLPAPGDLVIAFYGHRAKGDPYELAQVILVCAAASTAGTLVPYAIARRFGLPVAHKLADWIDVDTRRVDDWIDRVRRGGFRAVLIGRLVPGLRVAMSLVAGTAHVPVPQFAAGVFVAGAIYWTGWVLLGAFLGPRIEEFVAPAYIGYIVVLIPFVFVGYLVFRFLRARRRRRALALSRGVFKP